MPNQRKQIDKNTIPNCNELQKENDEEMSAN